MGIREPHVAGQFYPADARALRAVLETLIPSVKDKHPAIGVMMPHAGYVYSGATAGKTIAAVAVPDTVIMLGPNHTGHGAACSIMTQGVWRMPLGDVPVNEQLAAALVENSSYLRQDTVAHRFEHSLEVELPFLYYVNEHISMVPITIACDDLSVCREVGEGIAETIADKNVLLVASTDMTHYESQASAERKDHAAIEAVTALDEERLAAVVRKERITMCGFLPVYIMLVAAKKLGARAARLIDYRTSGAVSGDTREVVGYAGMVIE